MLGEDSRYVFVSSEKGVQEMEKGVKACMEVVIERDIEKEKEGESEKEREGEREGKRERGEGEGKGERERETCNSSLVARRPILSSSISGRYHTCSFRRKKSFPASRTMRGNVTRPTHHHEVTNLSRCHQVRDDGSIGASVEKMRAMIFACDFEEFRVIVLSIVPLPWS